MSDKVVNHGHLTRLQLKEQDHKSDMKVNMSSLLVLVVMIAIASCASFEAPVLEKAQSPGYQKVRLMDDRSLRAGFIER
jgi:hypothetical protein